MNPLPWFEANINKEIVTIRYGQRVYIKAQTKKEAKFLYESQQKGWVYETRKN